MIFKGLKATAWYHNFNLSRVACDKNCHFFNKMANDVGMWNVLVMGFSFMFMFTAFQTTSMIEVSPFIIYLHPLSHEIDTVFQEREFFLAVNSRDARRKWIAHGLYSLKWPHLKPLFVPFMWPWSEALREKRYGLRGSNGLTRFLRFKGPKFVTKEIYDVVFTFIGM